MLVQSHSKAPAPEKQRSKLHIGCGPLALPGWINIDRQKYQAVDRVLDVTHGLPFENVELVFAEHFIEHLPYPDALRFLTECRRALADDGVLRLSTPNLDWVWLTHYHLGQWMDPDQPIRDCFILNRAFRAWGHQFLYNLQTMTAVLKASGFGVVDACTYGVSRFPELHGLERHEKSDDSLDLPHVIVVEASGRSKENAPVLKEWSANFLRDIAAE